MKKLILFCSAALLFSTCTTELDILDDWEETMVVYGLIDQSQAKQYIRIEKAFLGPDNALSMAQNYDSINYLNALSVWLQEKDNNGNIVNSYQLIPDTISNKDAGIFYFPDQVVYSMNTPAVNTGNTYKIIVTNNESGKTVDATTKLIDDFNISRPSGPTISFVKFAANTMVDVEWSGSPNARIFQIVGHFYYTETDVNNVTVSKVTPDWIVGTVVTTPANAINPQGYSFDPNAFFRYLNTILIDDPNVLSRQDGYMEFTVYAAGEELQTYMEVNGPSTSLVQEKPVYTNINGGLGVFSSRYQKTKTNLLLTPQTKDTLASGQFTCHLRFKDRNGVVTGCQ